MKVNVSQKDIDKGVRGDSTKCPIALSIKRAFKNDNVKVYYPIILSMANCIVKHNCCNSIKYLYRGYKHVQFDNTKEYLSLNVLTSTSSSKYVANKLQDKEVQQKAAKTMKAGGTT